jgi:Flp pilus assembly protein TadB
MMKLKMLWAAHKLPIILGAAALLMVLAGLLYWQGRKDGRLKADAERAVANVEAMKINEKANTNASEDRVADAEQVLELKEELTDAVAEIPDDVPDDVAVALGCERLRRQGTDTTAIPACGRR